MSADALEWAWRQQCPTPIAKLVLLRLAHFASDVDNACHPSQRLIAEACGIARETVNRIVTELIGAGLLRRQSRLNERGGCASNLYVLPVIPDHTPCDAGSQTPVTQRSQPVNLESKKESTVLRTGADAPFDPVKDLWDRGVAILGGKNRSLLGKMVRQYGPVAVLGAIVACEEETRAEPASFFVRACEARARDAPQNYHQTPIGTAYEGAYRAAQIFDARQGARNSRDGDPPAFTLLDGKRTSLGSSGAD